jgi:hypothetical protein
VQSLVSTTLDLGLQTFPNQHSGTNLAGEVLINHSKFEATQAFFRNITSILQSVGRMLKFIDPEKYASYNSLYKKIAERSILSSWHTNDSACWQVLTTLINLTKIPDINLRDTVDKDGWVVQACFGEFAGGALQVPELGIELEFQPGDVVFLRPALLECTVAEFTGERFELVLYNHKDLQDFRTSDLDTVEGEGSASENSCVPNKRKRKKERHRMRKKLEEEDGVNEKPEKEDVENKKPKKADGQNQESETEEGEITA